MITTVREWQPASEGRYVDREYTDEEIEDIFDDDCLVRALLRRAQAAERRIDELERRNDPAATITTDHPSTPIDSDAEAYHRDNAGRTEDDAATSYPTIRDDAT